MRLRLAVAALLNSGLALRNSVLLRHPYRHRCVASRYAASRASALAAATDDAEADEGGVWDARSWRLTFDVGRTEGDESMPDDWAASGARMAFSVDVEVSADDASSKDNEVGRGALALRVTNEPEFVGEKGVQRVAVSNEGGWRIDHNDVLRCWLDVESCVEIKILRRVRAESSRRPPRHRCDACSMAWQCRFLAARPSQVGRVIAEK
jgi:hypothetical protein